MSIRSRGAGTTFAGSPSFRTVMTKKEIEQLWVQRKGDPSKADIASAIALAESSGNTKSNSNPCCKGLWQINVEVGNAPLACAMNPVCATDWTISSKGSKNGTDWTPWESYTNGRYKQYLSGSSNPSLGEEIPLIGGAIGDVEGAVGSVIGGAESAEQFLQQLAETLLDFRALGNLAAQASAWFIKLIAKAIWDYVIAPIVHWSERAVSFYWINFFGSGTERGSGFGYQLRNNAGAITILFWSMGYAILWSDGTSMTPVAAHESLLGQGVKGVEGAIARRNLIKPNKVKEKTPSKPIPKESKVPIQRKQTFTVARKRPVSVHTEGRQRASSQGFKPGPVPRPAKQKTTGEQKIILPPGIEQKERRQQHPAKPSRPRMGA